MSVRALSEAIEDLPYALSEQVLGYARSVEMVAPEIFKEAGVKATVELINALAFVAGIRKLYSIVDSNYWVVENTGAILARQDQHSVRIGGADFSRGAAYHHTLATIKQELGELLAKNQMMNYVRDTPYVEVARELANGR